MAEETFSKTPDDIYNNVYYSREWIQSRIDDFEEMDTNNNLSLSLEELKKGCKDKDPKIDEKTIELVFKTLDYDEDKKVTLAECIIFSMELDRQGQNYRDALVL